MARLVVDAAPRAAEGGGVMVKLTCSLKHWLWENAREKLPLIMLGHVELFDEDMQKQYLEWCSTDEGKRYLKGGDKYEEVR